MPPPLLALCPPMVLPTRTVGTLRTFRDGALSHTGSCPSHCLPLGAGSSPVDRSVCAARPGPSTTVVPERLAGTRGRCSRDSGLLLVSSLPDACCPTAPVTSGRCTSWSLPSATAAPPRGALHQSPFTSGTFFIFSPGPYLLQAIHVFSGRPLLPPS